MPLHCRAACRGRGSSRHPLTPVGYSTDQVKGVLTLQGDALSQAVSAPGPYPPTVLLVTRVVMA